MILFNKVLSRNLECINICLNKQKSTKKHKTSSFQHQKQKKIFNSLSIALKKYK